MLEKLRANLNAAPKALVWGLAVYLVVSFCLTLLVWKWSKFGGFLLTLLLFWHLLDRGQIARYITVTCLIGGSLFGVLALNAMPIVMLPLSVAFLYFAWYLTFAQTVKTWLQPSSKSEVEALTLEE